MFTRPFRRRCGRWSRPCCGAAAPRLGCAGRGSAATGAEQVAAFGVQDIDALAAFLGDKPFLMVASPCSADASLFGIVEAILTPPLPIRLRVAMAGHANLVAYRDRFARRYFPELFEAELKVAA